MTIIFFCISSPCLLSPLFLFLRHAYTALWAYRFLFSRTGARGSIFLRRIRNSSDFNVTKIHLSGYFDLTQTCCRLLESASMTCPGLWLPVRHTLHSPAIPIHPASFHAAEQKRPNHLHVSHGDGLVQDSHLFPRTDYSYHSTSRLIGQPSSAFQLKLSISSVSKMPENPYAFSITMYCETYSI